MLNRSHDNRLKALANAFNEPKSKSECLRELIDLAFNKKFNPKENIHTTQKGVYNSDSDYSKENNKNNSANIKEKEVLKNGKM